MIKVLISFTVLFLLSACDSGKSVQVIESCAIDQPSNGGTLATNQAIVITGWAYDKQSASSPEQVSVQLNGEGTHLFKAVRTKRPDVVIAFNTPGAEMSGYQVVVPANTLVAGQYEVVILQDTPERTLRCSREHIVTVTGEIEPAPVAVPAVIAPPVKMSIQSSPVTSIPVAGAAQSSAAPLSPTVSSELVKTPKKNKAPVKKTSCSQEKYKNSGKQAGKMSQLIGNPLFRCWPVSLTREKCIHEF